MKLSIIIPVYNEKDSVAELHTELVSVLSKLNRPYEIIFVDDGSKDGTLSELKKLKPVRIISFTRNFGKSQALQAGFIAAKGDYIFTMDGDLQDDPAEIPNFLEEMKNGSDLVVGWKQNRLDGMSKGLVSKIANRVTGWATGVYVHDMNCGYKLYKSDVAKNLVLTGDHHRYIPAIVAGKGYKVSEQKVTHRKREFGESKYGNFGRFFKSFFDFVTLLLIKRFMDRPMHFFGIIGTAFSFVGALILVHLAYIKFFNGVAIGNRPLLLLGVLFVVIGVQLFSSGFMGELLIRQNTGRKIYTVREEINQS